MPAKDVKAYVKRNKNDSVDAAACCEAVGRPTVRTVPVKMADQQAQLMQHRVRDLLIGQRTQANNDGEHSHVTVAFSHCRGEYDVMQNSRSVDRENPFCATRLTSVLLIGPHPRITSWSAATMAQ